jgi:hypothetical protein
VAAGTYPENIVLQAKVALLGGYPSGGGKRDPSVNATTIDGSKAGSVVTITSVTGVTIDGFTIRNAGGSGFTCIACSYVVSGKITNNNVMNSLEGDGIQMYHCQGTTISGNLISGQCGVLSLAGEDVSDMTVRFPAAVSRPWERIAFPIVATGALLTDRSGRSLPHGPPRRGRIEPLAKVIQRVGKCFD